MAAMTSSVYDPIDSEDLSVPVRNTTVYVVQVHRQRRGGEMVEKYDLTPAQAYGHLHYLLDGSQVMDINDALDKLEDGLAEMRSDDYLLLVGNPVFIGLAMIIAAAYTNGVFNVLQWQREEGAYKAVSIDVGFEENGDASES